MKRLLIGPDVAMLVMNGATSITVSDFQEEDFPVGSQVVICNTSNGQDIATAFVAQNTRMHKARDFNEIENTVDDQEDLRLVNIKLL